MIKGSAPWSNTGKLVTPGSNDILVQAGLDWRVHAAATQNVVDDVVRTTTKHSKRSLFRVPGDILLAEGIPENWVSMNNREAFDLFGDVVSRAGMRFKTLGSFQKGQRVWAIAEMPGTNFTLPEGDKVTGNVLFTHPHFYGNSMDIRLMAIREVDVSTMVWHPMAKIEHRKEDMSFAGGIKAKVERSMAEYQNLVMKMIRRPLTDKEADEFFRRSLPASGRGGMSASAKKAREVYDSDEEPSSTYYRNTLWHAFSTMTFVCDHRLGNTEDTRLSSAWYGKNRKAKLESLRIAAKIAG